MVTQGGLPEIEDVTLTIEDVSSHKRGKVVRVKSTHPMITRIGAMRRVAALRARGKALMAVGVVDSAAATIKNAKIQRLTHISGSPETVRRTGNFETLIYNVVVATDS